MSSDYYNALGRLRERSFGGSDVAAAPQSAGLEDTFFEQGPFVGGAEGVVQWFQQKVASEKPFRGILFLVGAPGNGKSYISRQITTGLRPLTVDDRRHRRKYEFRNQADRKLVVINDATIPDSDSRRSLIDDLDEAINAGVTLLVSVNRGVLFDELRRPVDGSVGRQLIEWVSFRDRYDFGSDPSVIDLNDSAAQSVRRASLRFGSESEAIPVCVVYLDGSSLLEVQIESFETEGHFPVPRDKYRVTRYSERNIQTTRHTPVGMVLEKFFAAFPEPPDELSGLIDPISANVRSLQIPNIQVGLQNLLRAAEISSSSRVSYRELWGVVAIAVLGPELCAPSKVGQSWWADPMEWVRNLQPTFNPSRARLEALIRLSAARVHQAIFGLGVSSAFGRPAVGVYSSPTFDLTAAVDPVKDALSGSGDIQGWASKVYDAFSGRADGDSILRDLLELLPGDDPVREYVSPFEWSLDDAVCAALNDTKLWLNDREADRRALLCWYSEYLLRLYALCHGNCAFQSEVNEWTLSWEYAAQNNTVTPKVDSGLWTLLLPKFESNQLDRFSLLPLFDGKVDPIVVEPVEPKLALRIATSIYSRARVEEDQIFIDLVSNYGPLAGRPIVSLVLDFDLLRECLACSGNFRGLTQSSDITTPRIERFRSALLQGERTGQQLLVVARGLNEPISTPRMLVGD